MSEPAIRFIADFVLEPQTLFDALLRDTVWDERMRARKTASFGVSYNYSQISYAEAPMPAALLDICIRIDAILGFHPNNCLLNYYADGEASMGFHSDTSEELLPGTGVAIVSLGATRPMQFRLKADKSIETSQQLTAGSLLFMSTVMQDKWLHAIPKAPNTGPRISATFRHILK